MKAVPHKILIAEDNDDDFLLIQDAFTENALPVELAWVKNGEELMEYLLRKPAPDLVLLDLKMPKKNGLEALKEIKTDPSLRRIPVVVFSTSSSETDIRAAYDLGANGYVKKPVGFVLFTEAVQKIYDFWLGLARRAAPETQ